MTIRYLTVPVILAAVAAAPACSDSSSTGRAGACLTDDDCAAGETCVGGRCVECVVDSDCGAGQTCDQGRCTTGSTGGSTLVVGPAGGGTLEAGNGTTLTFGSGSLAEGTEISVESLDIETVTSAGSEFQVVTAIQVETSGPVEEPPVLTVPNTQNLPSGSQLLLVEVVDLPDGGTGINLVGTASVSEDGQTITSNNGTDASLFLGSYGVDAPGTYLVIVTDGDQGFTVGQVTGSDGAPLAGAFVYSSSGVFVGQTDDNGYFAMPETIGSSMLFVSDPTTGAYGNAYVPFSETPQVVNLELITPEVVADGLVNGCLDVADFSSYLIAGNTAVVAALSPHEPTQGGGMVLMSTGAGAENDQLSRMDLTLTVPAGASSLRFAYKFLSDEYPEWVGSVYNDLFDIILYSSAGSALVAEEKVNDAVMTDSPTIYDGETAWRQVSIDVSSMAGSGTPITLSFTISDVGDSVIDSAALIDDLRFDDGECEGAGEGPVGDADGDTYVDQALGGDDCNDQDSTVYPGAPELCDGLDNDCDGVVDEGCVEDLPQSHHIDLSAVAGFVGSAGYAIYQRFDATYQVDLAGTTLTFAPNAAHTSYTVTASSLQWDANEGELMTGSATNCDDCYTEQAMPFAFSFYGVEYSTMYIGSNGYLTFVAGDSTYTDTVEYFLAGNPRISAMFDDLDTRGTDHGDDILVYTDTSKVVITYRNIQHYPTTGTSNTFQFVLYADGTIRISYDGIDDVATGSIAGITPGGIQ